MIGMRIVTLDHLKAPPPTVFQRLKAEAEILRKMGYEEHELRVMIRPIDLSDRRCFGTDEQVVPRSFVE